MPLYNYSLYHFCGIVRFIISARAIEVWYLLSWYSKYRPYDQSNQSNYASDYAQYEGNKRV